MRLRFTLDEYGFICEDAPVISNASTINYIKCHFDFKLKSWKDVDAVVAVFKSATYNTVSEVLLDSNNNCLVDPAVYKRGGNIQVKLIGDKYVNGQLVSTSHVSDIAEFYVKENVIIPTPTPSKYDVFVAELEKAEQAVEDVITEINRKAEEGEFDGADGTGISSIVYNVDGTVTVNLEDGRSFTSSTSMKGEKGDQGDPGDTISNISYGQDGTLVITTSDGQVFTSEYSMKGQKGDQGDPGDTGRRGLSIIKTTVRPQRVTVYSSLGTSMKYRWLPTDLFDDITVDEIFVGDIIETGLESNAVDNGKYYHYLVSEVYDDVIYSVHRNVITGNQGDKGDPGTEYFGTCTTAGDTAAKEVTIDGITELYMGLHITVYFDYCNSVDNPTLNVNSLGAKAVKLETHPIAVGTSVPSGRKDLTASDGTTALLWQMVELYYDGTRWLIPSYQIRSDWAESSYMSPTYIANKPALSAGTGTNSLKLGSSQFKTASGASAIAAGGGTTASGNSSAALGYVTVADQNYQTAVGMYNTENNTGNLFVVGCGDANARADAFAVDNSGNVLIAGNLIVGSTVITEADLASLVTNTSGVIEVSQASVSALPITITNSAIKANHVAIETVLSNPSAQQSNWTVTTSAGSLTISGTISGTTNITLLLAEKLN